MNTVGKHGATRLNAHDTGIREVAPVFEQLVTKPLDGEGKSRAVEERFSDLHKWGEGKDFKCPKSNVRGPMSREGFSIIGLIGNSHWHALAQGSIAGRASKHSYHKAEPCASELALILQSCAGLGW